MPALLTRISIGPNASVACATSARHSAGFDMSALMYFAFTLVLSGQARGKLMIVAESVKEFSDDVRAGGGQRLGDAEPYAGGRAGDDGGFGFRASELPIDFSSVADIDNKHGYASILDLGRLS